MLYLLDTNTVSDILAGHINVSRRMKDHLVSDDLLGLCRPVYFELLRGLIWRNSSNKLRTLRTRVIPLMDWIELQNGDWEQAARFWSDARRIGKQLGDPDLLLAALAYRENAIIVSSDTDFDVLPIRRENWRD